MLHKFDGVVNREPESLGVVERFKAIFDFSKSGKLKEDCKEFVDFFCAHHMMFDNPSTVKENINKSVLLLYQLRKIYVYDGDCWSYPDFRREVCFAG